MLKKIVIGFMAIIFGLTMLGTALALEKGNQRKGKYSYRNIYKSCMARGASETGRPILNPDAKTRAQWTRIFEKANYADFGCEEEWAALSQEEVSDIYGYLWEYAADSPSPAKCK
jgi:hypothetical protein